MSCAERSKKEPELTPQDIKGRRTAIITGFISIGFGVSPVSPVRSPYGTGQTAIVFLIMAMLHGLMYLPLTTRLASLVRYFSMVPGMSPIQVGICCRAKLTSKQPILEVGVYKHTESNVFIPFLP